MSRMLPELKDESGLRFVRTIVEDLRDRSGDIRGSGERASLRDRAWNEGWNFGLEEVLYRINMDLHYLSVKKEVV